MSPAPPRDWWDQLTGVHTRITEALGDLSRALVAMVPRVLDTETVILDQNGQASGQYRLPYRCLTVDSQSTKVLTAANTALNTQPGPGPGVAFVRVGGYSVLNLHGYAWSIYGGVAGETVTVSAYGNPQPPYAR